MNRFIAISQHNSNRVNIPEKTDIIYNFVDFACFARNTHPQEIPHKAKGGKIVLYLGGASAIKGFSVLTEALDYLDPMIFVLFGGLYENNKDYKNKFWSTSKPNMSTITLEKLKSKQNAIVIGPQTDIPKWIAACDMLVFPSVVPHFARPIIEAGAMAKPVIASNLEGMKEIVIDGDTGILVPPNNPKALARAINQLANDEDLSITMGEAGYQRIKKYFPQKWVNCEAISKTGTANASRVCWFVGSTPTLTTGIYVGRDDDKPMGKSVYPLRTAFPIWIGLNRELNFENKTFSYDPSLQEVCVNGKTGELLPSATDSDAITVLI